MSLVIRPIDLKSANEYVLKNHRHNGKVLVHRFSISCYDGERLCGVAICGNPSARKLDDGSTIEVKRLCTDGTRNACSILYGRCARIAKEMGFKKIITYITEQESGVSLRASGYVLENEHCGGGRERMEYPIEAARCKTRNPVWGGVCLLSDRGEEKIL